MNKLLSRLLKLWYIFLSKCIGLIVDNRDSNLILFGARDGSYYMDNSRALFEWYLSNNQISQYYWMTNSATLYNSLKQKGIPVARIDSLKGVWLLNKAKYAFYTNRLRDIAIDYRAVPLGLKMIFLSHGQSVKNTRLSVKEGVDSGYRNDTLKASAQIAFAVSTSPFMADVQAKSNGLMPEMYKLTGFPRNDWMFNPPQEAVSAWTKFTDGKEYSKVVLYAPTWRRKDPKTIMFPFDDFEINSLVRFVEANNILVLLRPHLQDLKDNAACINVIMKLTSLTPNFRLATINEFIEANFLLPFVDALISDYSSIYHDFLLLDRPIYFIPFDLDKFDRINGFKYPYLENLPGPIVSTQSQLVACLSDLVKNENDQYSGQRKKLSTLIYTNPDGNSCERLAKVLEA
jgi:CDP-glycerol glycerophosphotransferase (TagB/SpsB family)